MDGVGPVVRKLREAKGWSQAKLAGETRMAVSGVSQIENDKRNPNSATLLKLARALEVEVADLFPLGQPTLLEETSYLELAHEDFLRIVKAADLQKLGEIAEQIRDKTDDWLADESHDPIRPMARLGRVWFHMENRNAEIKREIELLASA
jgi:transcriptional regulator with XRE-family HTH domain